ncbi:MAG TPA: type I-U CRISPR-associated protein Csb2, partial [Polyangiales bacterium]|nr:type I-U CRISPR-associated protein Csb2 [Polyangiales bacterium]
TEPVFLYVWPLPELGGDELVSLSAGLYQLGRGVDPAWALGEVLDDEELAVRLRTYRGAVHHPTSGDGSNELAVPAKGSFGSIMRRFDAASMRLRPNGAGRTSFVQPPKAHFATVRYDGTPPFHLFELRRESGAAKSAPWATWRATSLVEHVRDMAVAVLSKAMPEREAEIGRVLVGRKPDGANAGPVEERVRIIPLPSIGHTHADQSIRRLLVQIPPGPLTEGDVLWALAGRALFDAATGEVGDTTLAAAPEDEMVKRYRAPCRVWRSVTPLVLGSALRRRIEPTQRCEQAKSAVEREAEQRTAEHAVAQALRHAGIRGALGRVRVQREPFETHGTRAERFAEGTRFAKEALWHVELELDREVRGPLVLGDGRFVGLGVMAPQIERGVLAFEVEGGLPADADTITIARALRRAVMVRVQAVLDVRGESDLPAYFHGHTRDGERLRSDRATHLAFSVDTAGSRLLIVPPHALDGQDHPFRDAALHLDTLELAVEGFTMLRAGRAGVLSLRRSALSANDPLLRSARVFQSLSDYVVCRHAKRAAVEQVIVSDVHRECARRSLPRPMAVRVASARGVAGFGVVARIELVFAVAVRGPILLGKTRYLGGGLFHAVRESAPTSRDSRAQGAPRRVP